MKMILALLLIAISAEPVFARLGESPDEIEARYGKPTGEAKKDISLSDTVTQTYKKDRYEITVIFWHGKSACESFIQDSEMTYDDQIALCEAISGGKKIWALHPADSIKKPVYRLTVTDGSAEAQFFNYQIKSMLSVMTKQFSDACLEKTVRDLLKKNADKRKDLEKKGF